MSLRGRATRGELLVWTSGGAGVTWLLLAESVDTRGLATVLLLTAPLMACGMSAAARWRPGRRHACAVGVLSFLLPASSLPRAVDAMDGLREERSRSAAHAHALAAALPPDTTVASATNLHEPIASIWRFTGVGGPRVVEAPLDVRRLLRLRDESPGMVTFEHTRLQLEVLGFRLGTLGFQRSGLPAMARMRRWEGCTAVWSRGWVSVAAIVQSRYVGVGFGERSGDAAMALYVTAFDPQRIEPGRAQRLQPGIEEEVFDRRDPSDADRLRRRLSLDGVAAWRLGGRRFVRRLRVGRITYTQPLAALRIGGGRSGDALARVVVAPTEEPMVLCRASRRATRRRFTGS